jgi:hypothetical protein
VLDVQQVLAALPGIRAKRVESVLGSMREEQTLLEIGHLLPLPLRWACAHIFYVSHACSRSAISLWVTLPDA